MVAKRRFHPRTNRTNRNKQPSTSLFDLLNLLSTIQLGVTHHPKCTQAFVIARPTLAYKPQVKGRSSTNALLGTNVLRIRRCCNVWDRQCLRCGPWCNVTVLRLLHDLTSTLLVSLESLPRSCPSALGFFTDVPEGGRCARTITARS